MRSDSERIAVVETGLRVWQESSADRAERARAAQRLREAGVPPFEPWTLDRLYALVVLDVETATANTRRMPGFDAPKWRGHAQELLFGRAHIIGLCRDYWRPHDHAQCVKRPYTAQEVLFYADDLPPYGVEELHAIHAEMQAEVRQRYIDADDRELLVPRDLCPLSVFLHEVLWPLLRDLQDEVVVCGYNLFFDLSRLACCWRETKRTTDKLMRGGFTLDIFQYQGQPSTQHPSLQYRHLSSGGARLRWGAYKTGSKSKGIPVQEHPAVSNLLDSANLVRALTGHNLSLEKACLALGLPDELCKHPAETHGVITREYAQYNRQDVIATTAVTLEGLGRYAEMGLEGSPCTVTSAATLGKRIVWGLGGQRRLVLQGYLAKQQGIAMAAYYGGRVECRVRRAAVPGILLDWLAMYGTVSVLAKLWEIVTAERVWLEDCTREVQRLLADLTADDLFNPAIWPKLNVYVLLQPEGDALPFKGEFRDDDWRLAVLPYHKDAPRWWALPDVLASKLLTGKAPKMLRAVRLRYTGKQPYLRPLTLYGRLRIDPARDDVYKLAVEERVKVKRGEPPYADLTTSARKALAAGLKTIVNSDAYGIWMEINPETPTAKAKVVTIYRGEEELHARTRRSESPGPFAFPMLGALVTSYARLMLALGMQEVAQRGGAYAMCDTDSLFVVSTERGGPISIQGAGAGGAAVPQTLPALSYADVQAIVDKFARLNPYDQRLVPGSIVKIEDVMYRCGIEGHDTAEHLQKIDSEVCTCRGKDTIRETWYYGTAAKRYALCDRLSDGRFEVVDFKESGLGLYVNLDFARKKEFWTAIVNEQSIDSLPWAHELAVKQTSVRTPHVAKLFDGALRPGSFVVTATLRKASSLGGDGAIIIAPFERDADDWEQLEWRYRDGQARVEGICLPRDADDERALHTSLYATETGVTLGDALGGYATHYNPQWLGPDGQPCSFLTRGYLRGSPKRSGGEQYFGKESSDWDELEEDLLDPNEAQPRYEVVEAQRARYTPRKDITFEAALRVMKAMGDDAGRHQLTRVRRELGKYPSARTLRAWRLGMNTPAQRVRKSLIADVGFLTARRLAEIGISRAHNHLENFERYLAAHGAKDEDKQQGADAALLAAIRSHGQQDVARRLYVPQQTISRWLKTGIPKSRASRALELLRVNVGGAE
jgi:hypothetical protein